MQADPDPERTMIRRPAASAAAILHVLLLRQHGAPTRRVPLGETPLRIGRGPQNELVLASPEVSRQHCTIGLAGGVAMLTDLQSTNGVHVDGARIDVAATLPQGARLSIGPYTLVYERGSAAELAEAEERERDEARAVGYVQALLPPPLRDGAVRAQWAFVPSAQLGGDAFGYRWLDDTRFAVFLLDVSGHGVGSALLAVSAANMLRAQARGADPADVLHSLNTAFQMDDHHGLFFTIWYGVYDAPARLLRYASAGHHPAYLATDAGLQPLATRAPAIGMSPAARFRAGECAVPAGSALHLFSDGAFEVTLADGSAGAIEHLLPLLQAPGGPDATVAAMRELTGRAPFADDVSLVQLHFI